MIESDTHRETGVGDAMDDARAKFHHPYTPYEIQLQFMRALYACLEDGKVAVFESPTGKQDCPVRLQLVMPLTV